MKTISTKKIGSWSIIILTFLLVGLLPSTAISSYIELSGVIFPEVEKHGSKVYTLKGGDREMYFRVVNAKTSGRWGNNNGDYLRRSTLKQLRLVGGKKEALKALGSYGVCDALKIKGHINYSSGLLRVVDVGIDTTPRKRDAMQAKCKL